MNCPNCQAPIDAEDAFCRGCGTKQEQAQPGRQQHGERRQLTALFYDLVGSTELSTRLDAEDLQTAVARYQAMAVEVAESFGGTPANTMGDGGLVYFGYPMATEDDPLRAVMAGTTMVASLEDVNRELREELPDLNENLAMRVGVHTGTVVLGAEGSDLGAKRLATGEALNQAARIESLAPVNGIAVSDVTADRVRGVVDLKTLGHHEVKGIAEPIEVFRVDAVRPGHSRLVATATTSPLVGREAELVHITALWDSACGGMPAAVLLRGEAGIGKSRLHQQFRTQLSGTMHSWFELSGSEVMGKTSFWPIVQAMRLVLGLDGTSTSEGLDQLRQWLGRMGLDEDRRVEVLAEFLMIIEPSTDSDPNERRTEAMDAVCDWWLGIARLMPTVLVAEDMHWFDPSTSDLLVRLWTRSREEAGSVSGGSVSAVLLLIGTARPEFEIAALDDIDVVELEPLDEAEIARIVGNLGAGLSPEQRAALVLRSDGVPLFAEELVHAAGETGDRRDAMVVPRSLRDLMTARLDRLGSAKEVVQVASLLGREFSPSMLRVALDRDDIDHLLAKLVERQFITRVGVDADATFQFRHALLQDASRDSMLRRDRQEEHRRIAELLMTTLASSPDARPEVIGHHLEESGDHMAAIAQFSAAGRASVERAAVREAGAHFRHAIALLDAEPDGPESRRIEVELQLAMGTNAGHGEGFAAADAGIAFERAEELATDDEALAPQLARALAGRLQHCFSAATFDTARVVADRLQDFAKHNGDEASELAAHRALCQINFWTGRFPEMQYPVKRALELYDADAPAKERYVSGIDTGVLALVFGALAEWAAGRLAQSREMADRAIALARTQDDIYQLCYSAAYLSVHGILLNEPARAEELASISHQIAIEHGFRPLASLTKWTGGWGRAGMGQSDGLEQAIEGVNELAGIGVGAGAPGCMAVLAEMCVKADRLDEGMAYISLGEALSEQSGQHFYDAEIHRSSALLQLAVADKADSETDRVAALDAAAAAATKAREIARQQQSPSLSLRAVQPMLEVMGRRGDEAEATTLLQEVMDLFPDESDGVDLHAARAQLAQ